MDTPWELWPQSQEIQEMKNKHVNVTIPSWDEQFMAHAIIAARRSPDSQTKVGAILIEPEGKTILTTGYNGYVRKCRDDILPNVRPDKYDWMIHAEHNAILNCSRLGRATLNSVCYCTHKPCKYCLQYLHQSGITEIVTLEGAETNFNPDVDRFYKLFDYITYGYSPKIREIKVSTSLLKLLDGV